MIRVDPSLMAGFFFAVLVCGAFVIWRIVWSRQQEKGGDVEERSRIRRCSYCGHAFTDYLAQEIVICPLCKSYLEGKSNG